MKRLPHCSQINCLSLCATECRTSFWWLLNTLLHPAILHMVPFPTMTWVSFSCSLASSAVSKFELQPSHLHRFDAKEVSRLVLFFLLVTSTASESEACVSSSPETEEEEELPLDLVGRAARELPLRLAPDTSPSSIFPGSKRPPGLNLSDTLAASSGRTWRKLRDQPLLAVVLKECPAVPASFTEGQRGASKNT